VKRDMGVACDGLRCSAWTAILARLRLGAGTKNSGYSAKSALKRFRFAAST
jgi:hypothetical protein